MNRHRVKIAARIAALQSFREESARQGLAEARGDVARANARVEAVAGDLSCFDATRIRHLAGSAMDIGYFTLYSHAIAQTLEMHALLARRASELELRSEGARGQWIAEKAQRQTDEDRAERMAREWLREIDGKLSAERLDLWMMTTKGSRDDS